MTKNKGSKRRKCNSFNAPSSESKSTESEMPKKPKLRTLSETDRRELETLFSKKLTYTKAVTSDHTKWIHNFVMRLKDIKKDSALWQDDDLMKLKKEVNDLKDQLSGKDIESWHTHTTECNLAGKIIPYVKSLGVELCTQAWVKFYEIVNTFTIVPDQPFISVHLCEAPGAFIAALNHHLWQIDFPHDWDWCATTLNPYDESNSLSEMIADDRLIRSTHHKWYFGLDGSGDIKAHEHIEGLLEKLTHMERKMRSKVLLVTADGSKDCQENPGEQEALLSELHYCEVLAACLMLAPGGCLVLKIFTMFEAATIGLMALLNVLFESVNPFKPATSKSGNSEMYVVCTGYQANMEREALWTMLRVVRDYSITGFVLKVDISPEFIQEHRQFCHKFASWQSDTINRNMRLFEMPPSQFHHQLKQLQEVAVEKFVERTNVGCSQKIQRLVPFSREKSMFYVETPFCPSIKNSQTNKFIGSPSAGISQHKNLKGTFHLRQNINALSFEERIQLMDIRETPRPNSILTSRCSVTDKEVNWWASSPQETATLPQHVYNSRLCDSAILDDYNFLLQHSQYLQLRVKQHEDHIKSLASLVLRALEIFLVPQPPSKHQHHHLQQHNHNHQQQNHQHKQQQQHHHHQHQQYNQQQQQAVQSHYRHDETQNFYYRDQHLHHKNQQHHYQHHHQQQQQHRYPHQQINQSHHTHTHTDELNNLSQLSVSPNKDRNINEPKSNHGQNLYANGKNPNNPNSSPNGRYLQSPEKPSHQDQSKVNQDNSDSPSRHNTFNKNTRHSPSPEKTHHMHTPSRYNPKARSKLQFLGDDHEPHSKYNITTSSSPEKQCTTTTSQPIPIQGSRCSSFKQDMCASSMSPSPVNHGYISSPRQQQHYARLPMLQVICVENGCQGEHFSSFMKFFSNEAHVQNEGSKRQNGGSKIEVQVQEWDKDKDIKVNGGDYGNAEGIGCGDVVYFVNMTQLLCVEGSTSRVSAVSGDGGDRVKETGLSSSLSTHFDCEELSTKQFGLNQISLILQRLPIGSNLLLLTSSFLTRFHSGLLYIVARHFNQIQITSDPNLWLHQVVICRGFTGVTSPSLLHHLSALRGLVGGERGEEKGVVETVRFTHILNDRKFCQFLTAHNNHVLSGFINLVLDYHKK